MAQRQFLTVATLLSLLGSVPGVHAEPWFESGRLLATTGVNQVEGASGGSLEGQAQEGGPVSPQVAIARG